MRHPCMPLILSVQVLSQRTNQTLNNTFKTVRPFNILSFLTTSERPRGGLPFTLVIYIQYMELTMQLLSILPLLKWSLAFTPDIKASILRKSPLFALTTGCVFVKPKDNTGKSRGMTTVRMNLCTDFTTNNDKRV